MKRLLRSLQFGLIILLVPGSLLNSWPTTIPLAFSASASLSLQGVSPSARLSASAQPGIAQPVLRFRTGTSTRNDTSPRLSAMPPASYTLQAAHPASPLLPMPFAHSGGTDPVVQSSLAPQSMPPALLNFEGIPFPGVSCNCAPPDTNGAPGEAQYVQIVNTGLQVFNKTTGASELGPIGIASLWGSFGGVCENDGAGDPVVLYDQIAHRWVVSQFAGLSGVMTDECIAVSTSNDATGAWHRYDFTLGTDFFDYPKLALWPDAYYLGENVYNTAGTSYLGPQPFAFDRSAMLSGSVATFVTTAAPLDPSLGFLMPANLDGSNLPPAGAPDPWMGAEGSTWPLYRFHIDFTTPLSSTFTLATSLTPATYSDLCPSITACVPQFGSADNLDGLGDRPMFRLAYRRFADGHEALVGNRSVASNSVAGIRWWEVNHATSGTPGFVQQSTYQPSDGIWRWMGSAAMDAQGDLAIGFSASSATIHPQIRYAGRLATDPLNALSQGEATLFAGAGSQTGSNNRWGDYSDLTLDPVDGCTFWYTTEYYATTSQFNWRTRIGSFRFPSCASPAHFTLSAQPQSQAICAPSNAVYTMTVGSVNNFSFPVTLSVSGAPAGASTSFSVNPVTPPGASLLTISNTLSAAAGSYVLNLIGAALPLTKTTTVTLSLSTSIPLTPTLVMPADGATGVPTQPTFQWAPALQAASYTLEIATDNGFAHIIHTASGLTGTSYNGATLAGGKTYYWRIHAVNTCGTSPNSTASSFTTHSAFSFLTLNAHPARIDEGQSISLTGTFTDSTGILTHTVRIDWGEGSLTHTVTALGLGVYNFSMQHQYLDNDQIGSQAPITAISVTLSNKNGLAILDSLHITVTNVAPSVAVGPDRQTHPHVALQFTGVFTDPGVLDTHTMKWDFGDGTILTGTLTPVHAFASVGAYTVTLTVTDDDMGVGKASLVVHVSPYKSFLPQVGKPAPGLTMEASPPIAQDNGMIMLIIASRLPGSQVPRLTGNGIFPPEPKRIE